uniref:Uncharacterized protein n=1 Tax=Araucaria cunninghamii TaxID=56994 RepID=A0A0D6R716_ARACU
MARLILSQLRSLRAAHTNMNMAVLRTYACGRSYSTEASDVSRTSGRDKDLSGIAAQQRMMSKGEGEEESASIKKKVFWMKDPATGDWIPEDHFDDIDAAELRAKLLKRK